MRIQYGSLSIEERTQMQLLLDQGASCLPRR